MNNDRFLTRVWDTQEKKMLYPSGTGDPKSAVLIENKYRTLMSVTATSLLVTYYCGIDYNLTYIPFGDRFVPMMCTAAKTDDAKKLLYESDIIKYNNSLAIIKWDLYEGLYAEPLIYDDACIFHSTAFEACSYVGNRWENEKLLEVKE